VRFFEDDAPNLSLQKYDACDIVICAGPLYHRATAPAREPHNVAKRLLSGRHARDVATIDRAQPVWLQEPEAERWRSTCGR